MSEMTIGYEDFKRATNDNDITPAEFARVLVVLNNHPEISNVDELLYRCKIYKGMKWIDSMYPLCQALADCNKRLDEAQEQIMRINKEQINAKMESNKLRRVVEMYRSIIPVELLYSKMMREQVEEILIREGANDTEMPLLR